jgi:hypothetical protein
VFFFCTFLSFTACNQDPVFYAISLEVEPRDPRVQGTPTAMVTFDGTLYVASRFSNTIYRTDGSAWDSFSSEDGKAIIELAATTSGIYALMGDVKTTELWKYNNSSWSLVTNNTSYTQLQTIYGVGTDLFIGVMKSPSSYAILLYNENGTGNIEILENNTGGILTGAASDGTTVYLGTAGGVYKFESSTLTSVKNINVCGMITVGTTVIAATTNGIYSSADTFATQHTSVSCSGALALYGTGSSPTLLLVGLNGGGYGEIQIENGSTITNWSVYAPGDGDPSSISDYDQYSVSLEIYPLTSLKHFKNILFASTLQKGLWSYRDSQWNTEE